MGLIRLEFKRRDDKIGVAMPERLVAGVATNNPKLLDRVRSVLRMKHYSLRTEDAYVDWRVKAAPTR